MSSYGLKPGTILRHDTYRIERVLGQGGFGITYLAIDLSLERLVAIKEFFPKDYCDRDESTSHLTIGTSNNTELVSRLKAKFLKEARNIAKLDHPGIIKIHTAFEENNTAYYVMDYIEGESLSEKVKRSGPIVEADAIKYISQVGEALEYIHKHKINHLDIKPANIMIRRADNRPILIDFGLSKQYDAEGNQTSTTPTGISHGYAPLEQYKAGGVSEFSPQTDVYSLAATLYYIISGAVPPHASDLIEDGISFPTGFPTDIQPAISKAMSSARKNRHSGVSAFISSLKLEVVKPNVKPRPTQSEDTIFVEVEKPKDTPKSTPRNEDVRQQSSFQATPNLKPNNPSPTLTHIEPALEDRWPWGVIVPIILLVVVIIVAATSKGCDNSATNEPVNKESNVETPKKVNGVKVNTALGDATYYGEVDENGLPNGNGTAFFSNDNDALKYSGNWVHGVMNGKATHTLRNGDVFEGTFKNDHYYEGKYTIASNGEYYNGKFVNGKPSEDKWYDKNGKKL